MILLLAPLDAQWVLICAPSTPSEEFLGLSEIGDLIDSPRCCLLSDALIDLGMHFERPEVESSLSSLSSTESAFLQLLQVHKFSI